MGLDIRRVSPFEISDNARFLWLSRLEIGTVLDIGANIGQFSAHIHSVLPDAWIYAFEPLSDCYADLVARMAGVPNFRAFDFALGEQDCEALIRRNKYLPASSLLAMEDLSKATYPFTGEEPAEPVRVQRLDGLADKLRGPGNILIKIDVQGFEDRVIEGGKDTIRRAKLLLVETSFRRLYKEQPLFDEIYVRLKELGFSYEGSLEQYPSPVDGGPLQEDSIFVRSV